MEEKSTFAIESRIQLNSALAEAAEIEHNLMCLYLYAMFSLKKSVDEGVSPKELEAISRWRKVILGVALEEMNHLTLVSNLMTSIGASPNFMRPNFPSAPGYYPSGIIIELARFNLSTLDHFIFLERPRSMDMSDGESFDQKETYTRLSEKGRLMPTSGDYQTVGALYLSIQEAFENLCSKTEEKMFFCGSKDQQIGPLDSPLPGLTLVTSKKEAMRAIDTIITQGEGSDDVSDSHFQRFLAIKREYQELLKENPQFEPARPVARNPVMRKPLRPENRVWVTEPLAAQYMDLANTLYNMMLRVLVQVYAVEARAPEDKALLLEASYGLMRAMSTVAETLTHLPANDNDASVLSGMSFAMVRSLAPLGRFTEKQLMLERFTEVIENMNQLQNKILEEASTNKALKNCVAQLKLTIQALSLSKEKISQMTDGNLTNVKTVSAPIPEKEKVAAPAPAQSSPSIEISETDKIKLLFEGKRCIHSRHCVTELPRVFKANTPGEWIFAGNTEPEILAAVARECPSGAIRYEGKNGFPNELTPEVNMLRIRESGPYAILGELTIDGVAAGTRATLCRCGQSKNKPFCDGAHGPAKFVATGEPLTIQDAVLETRNGKIQVNRIDNGPLQISGNVEICAGTGRVVLRTKSVKLCRCGHSNNKPICDSSHVGAGFSDSVN